MIRKAYFIIFIFWFVKLTAQDGIIQNNNYRYGPCNNYLNILEYKYSFADLKKDTLKYKAASNKSGAIFLQKNNRLLNARIFNKKGEVASGGDFKNGNGKLIINYSATSQSYYSFLNGKLNDTSAQMINGKISRLFIFKDNVLVKQDWKLFNRVVANYDANGLPHDSTLIFGHPPKKLYLFFFTYYYDSYNGKLYQVNIYEHGNLKEQIFYKKDGAIKKRTTIKYIPKKYSKKIYKSCL